MTTMTDYTNPQLAQAVRMASEALGEIADLLDGHRHSDVSKTMSKAINEANALDEFRVASESKGLSRAEASAAMRKHGVSPRAMGGWVSHHWITHDKAADRRWLTRAGDARVKALRELIRQG